MRYFCINMMETILLIITNKNNQTDNESKDTKIRYHQKDYS